MKIHIPIQTDFVITNIKVRRKRKRKLSELYPQRAIIEEARRDSSLVHANDWIDHNYYENLVDKMDEINDRLIRKYGPKVVEKQSKESKSHKVPEMPTLLRKIEIKD